MLSAKHSSNITSMKSTTDKELHAGFCRNHHKHYIPYHRKQVWLSRLQVQ